MVCRNGLNIAVLLVLVGRSESIGFDDSPGNHLLQDHQGCRTSSGDGQARNEAEVESDIGLLGW
jgi:hypothetical protein